MVVNASGPRSKLHPWMHKVECIAEVLMRLHVERFQLTGPINDKVVLSNFLSDRFLSCCVKIVSPRDICNLNRVCVRYPAKGDVWNRKGHASVSYTHLSCRRRGECRSRW